MPPNKTGGFLCLMKKFIKTIKIFYIFLLKKKFWVVVLWLLLISAPAASSFSPYFYKLFVDEIPNFQIDVLMKILTLFLVVKTVSVILDAAKYFVGDIITIDALADTQSAVFRHIHTLDFAFHTTKSSGSLISVMKRGEGAFWDLFFSIHHRIVDVLVRFVIMLIFFAGVDTRILWLVTASFLLAILVAIGFVRYNIKFRSDVNDQEDKISGVIVDNMISFETVKLFAKEVFEQKRLLARFTKWKKVVWKYVLSFRGLDFGMGAVTILSSFVILLYAIRLTVQKSITIGDFVLVTTFLQSFYSHLFELVWGMRQIAKSYTDVEKFFGILENDVKVKDSTNPVVLNNVDGELEFKNVSFSYEKGDENALKNVSLKIRQGQTVALVGRSGAGKTTMVKLLLRFFDVNEGKITVDSVDVRDLKKDNLRKFFGVVPQEPILFNNTIRYNISYGKTKATKAEIIAAAKMANIDEFIKGLPKGYKTQVGERGIKLSGGQKQRVAIARMILSDPSIVIFDEATSQLDSENEKMIQDAFWKATKNKTTIIIAHRLSTAMKADKIVVLENGKVIEEGSHNSLIDSDDSLYKYLWDLQTAQV